MDETKLVRSIKEAEVTLTFNDMGGIMVRSLEHMIEAEGYSDASRDFAIAKTHLEDALTRYNSARYRQKGTWFRSDPDKSDDPADTREEL